MDHRMTMGQLVRRTLVVLLLVGIALLLPMLSTTLLLIFAAILVAVLIRSAAWPFMRVGLGNTPAVLLGLLSILVATYYLGGNRNLQNNYTVHLLVMGFTPLIIGL